MKKKILLALVALFAFTGILHAAGSSSPITGFSWDNVRKVIRMMTSDGQEVTVDQTPKEYLLTLDTTPGNCTTSTTALKYCSNIGSATRQATVIPYRAANGTWRAKINFAYDTSSALNGSVLLSGMTFQNGVNGTTLWSACAATSTGSVVEQAYVTGNTNQLTMYAASNATYWAAYCDVGLASKPTWAD